MYNRDIYQKDPTTRKLVNEGVAYVNDDTTSQALVVLRYELETFVCDGQYEKGMAHILETYLSNINQSQQPGVWVSGFFGSGKSHLVKMLRALWVDTAFDDGATARGIANLPQGIRDHLRNLDTEAKRHGGLHAASGTLGSGASGSVRLALLRIIFKSAGLPEQYHAARFVMWLRSDGIYDQVREHVEKSGYDWQEELDNFHVAEGLYQALCEVKPSIFAPSRCASEILPQLYPIANDISSDEMIKAIRQALTKDGKFPLTLVVLDEVQQYIEGDSQRSIEVQEIVEACCKSIGGKLLFIGTGQTAVTGTHNLKKLEGRFTVRIELSDADVDTVIRQVILAKKPEAKIPIEQVMQANLGEVSRHLSGTSIGHRQDDISFFPQDYPILPVRRRFWENALRVLDQSGTDSQLRNQLSMVHKVIQTNLDKPLGYVVPADHLYFDSADKLLQTRNLPRNVHEKTMSWINGSDDEQLMARACGLVFLINKLGSNKEIGIRANIDSLADLLVDDITSGSSSLRSRLPGLLDRCELLIKVNDEYRIQTEESAAWNDEFQKQRSDLANKAPLIETERHDRIRKRFNEVLRKVSLNQGSSNEPREICPVFDSKLPADADKRICIWLRDGWSIDENSVRADARQAGNNSPTVFVFIPKRSADDLRNQLIDYKASYDTLETKGVPGGPDGLEAQSAMRTIMQTADAKISALLNDAFSGARVFQGGGNEILGNNLQEMLIEAAANALQRLYPQFHIADHPGWAKVYEKAQKGAPDALKAVGDEGEPAKNQVCKTILGFIAGGKKGAEIRGKFESDPYGWPKDAIDGGLQVLLVAGLILAQDERGQALDYKSLERKNIGKTIFKVESAQVATAQRLQVYRLLQKAGLGTVQQGNESAHIPQFIQKMNELADMAGGDAPRPSRPDTSFLDEIRRTAGNEQLLAIYNQRDELTQSIDSWASLAEQISKRLPNWSELKRLMAHARSIQDADIIQAQVQTIEHERQLLDDPDPVTPLIANLTQLLRDELNKLKGEWDAKWQAGENKLKQDQNWNQLDPEQRHELRAKQQLTEAVIPSIQLGNTQEILATLDKIGIQPLRDRIAALPGRYEQILFGAAQLMEPDIQNINLPARTLKTEADVAAWLDEARAILLHQIKQSPVRI